MKDSSEGKLTYRKRDLVVCKNLFDDERVHRNDREQTGLVKAYRHLSDKEVKDWYDSDASKGMNDAGESHLPPSYSSFDVPVGKPFLVLRAKCAPHLGYYTYIKMTELLDTETGCQFYVRQYNVSQIIPDGGKT